jgi:hypothetical protein
MKQGHGTAQQQLLCGRALGSVYCRTLLQNLFCGQPMQASLVLLAWVYCSSRIPLISATWQGPGSRLACWRAWTVRPWLSDPRTFIRNHITDGSAMRGLLLGFWPTQTQRAVGVAVMDASLV